MGEVKIHCRSLGRTGLQVSELGFGSWVSFSAQVDDEAAYVLMRRAYELGINFFDNAEGYAAGESESIMGRSIARGIRENVWAREDLVVTTKLFFGARGERDTINSRGLSRKHVIEGMRGSLKRMQLEYVDVVFCHRPDPLTPIEETVRAMNFLLDHGMAFYWGTSEWSAAEITEAQAVASRLGLVPPCVEQPEYNLFKRARVEVEYAPLYASASGLGTTIWSPLASGILSGKYSGGAMPEGARLALQSMAWLKEKVLSDERLASVDRLRPIAEKLGCSMAQLAIAWTLANDRVSCCLIGATRLEQLEENVRALAVVPKLTSDVLASIDEVMGTKPPLHPIHVQAAGFRVRP